METFKFIKQLVFYDGPSRFMGSDAPSDIKTAKQYLKSAGAPGWVLEGSNHQLVGRVGMMMSVDITEDLTYLLPPFSEARAQLESKENHHLTASSVCADLRALIVDCCSE